MFASDIWRKFCQVVNIFCCVHVLHSHVAQLYYVTGPSMFPTYNATGDLLLLERISTRFRKVNAGDIVVACSPENPKLFICKRVLALEGDSITVLPEPFSEGVAEHVLIPKGHVWLQGDNLSKSRDSRHYGPVPYALIKGKICLRVWPPYNWNRF